MKPLRDRIFVLQDEERTDVTQFCIIVKPGVRYDSQEQLGKYGTVVEIGPDVDRDQLKPGDRVCYGDFEYPKYQKYLVLQDKDICGVIEE